MTGDTNDKLQRHYSSYLELLWLDFRYEDGHDNLEPIAQVSCGITAGVVAETWLQELIDFFCFKIQREDAIVNVIIP